ncbi:MAG: cytochrome c peroxidase [Methylobacter sp.]
MNTVSILSRKTLPDSFELAVFPVIITLMFAFTQPVRAESVSQPMAPAFCDANAMRAFPEMPGSLKCTPAPEPYIIDESGNAASISPSIIKNKAAAIALGKMLFWDNQVGSDGIACASCHFQAGADNRIKNQIDPGLRNASGGFAGDGITPIGDVFDFMASNPNTTNLDPLPAAPGKGPNYTLKKEDFPLRKYQEPENPVEGQPLQADRNAEVVYDSDDVISSQGVYLSTFNRLSSSGKKEKCNKRFPLSGPDMPLFNVAGYSVRQVEPRNTPTVINAVYNFRNFWDGRANNVFNGLDPFGMRRFANPETIPTAEIYVKISKGKLSKKRIAIYNASLASQAVGPALSDFEMSCGGKDFSELGRKMLALKPLKNQTVDPTDSVLGPYANQDGDIKSRYSYKALVKKAFNSAYWDVPDTKTIDGYTLIENNFSLFWGLAVQAYEATLVSDDSRFDQAQEDLINGRDKLTEQEQNGLNLFFNQGKCIACHLGSEFTAASVKHVSNIENTPNIGKYTERMLRGDGGIALYDAGFYNIGVRPSAEDIGAGASDPYGFPLSFTRNAKMKANDPMDFLIENPNISNLSPDPFQTNSALFSAAIGCVSWNAATTSWGTLCGTDPVVSDERDAVDGTFKASTLRNVELTGPYFHNGGQATLEQVVRFYNRGGDRKDLFPKDPDCGGALLTYDAYGNSAVAADPETGLIDSSGFLFGPGSASNIAPDMAGAKALLDTSCNSSQPPDETLKLSNTDVDDLVAFLKALTDERVRWEQAPFDHPSLTIPNGHVGDENWVKFSKETNKARQQTIELPAVGAAGRGAKGLPALQSFDSRLQ